MLIGNRGIVWLIPFFATIFVSTILMWGSAKVAFDVSGIIVQLFLLGIAAWVVIKLIMPMLEKSLIKKQKINTQAMIILTLIAGGLLFFGVVGAPLSAAGSATVQVAEKQFDLFSISIVALIVLIVINRKK